MSVLPESWAAIALSDAVINITITDKKIPQKEYLSEGAYPVFDQGQDYIGGYSDNKEKLVSCELPVLVFGDHTRVVKFVNQPFAPGADGIKVLQPQHFYNPRLLEYFTRHIATHLTNHGYARHYQHLVKSIIPLPPVNEQYRIVAKIEELFSELDKGIENLKTARAQLKVYRQALLKHAFEGKLTAQWRAENQDKLETAAALLKRIQLESAQRYQQQLADWQTNGGSKPKAPKPLPPLTAEELAELPELPEGWGWEKLGNIADLIGGVTKGKNLEGKEKLSLPYLRVANVQDGYLDLSEIKFIEVEVQDKDKYRLEFGDVLYTEGGDKDKLGRGAVWRNQIESCIHQNHIFRARVFGGVISPEILSLYSQTKSAKKYFFRHAKQTTNLASINLTVLANLPVAIVCQSEQKQILQEIEARLSEVDQLDQSITTSLQQAETLRQSILKKAFSGQLVPQDQHDEPASELLNRIKGAMNRAPTTRIKAERAKSPQPPFAKEGQSRSGKSETIQRQAKKVSA